jgi:hypothetical protein
MLVKQTIYNNTFLWFPLRIFHYKFNVPLQLQLMILLQNLLDPAYNAAGQPHLDAVGMPGAVGQQLRYYPFCKLAGCLVLLLYHLNPLARLNMVTNISIHHSSLPSARAGA